MTTLRMWLRALAARGRAGERARIESLRASIKTLQRDVRRLQKTLATATAEIGGVEVTLAQIEALRAGEQEAPARLDALERVLDAGRTAAHVRRAIAGATVLDASVPYAIIEELLPAEVYAAVLEAIPSAVFFAGSDAHGWELRMPPAIAPTHAVATWAFLTGIVDSVVAPALAERFSDLPLIAGSARIVRRCPGGAVPPERARSEHVLTTILNLARPGDSEDYGSRLRGGARTIPFRANSALTVLGPVGTHEYVLVPGEADLTCHTYEISLGVTLPHP